MEVESAAGSKKPAQFVGYLLLALDPLTVTRWREAHQAIVPEWRRRVGCEGLPKLVKLENPLAEVLYGDGRGHSCSYVSRPDVSAEAA
jgi:hypothetical protein